MKFKRESSVRANRIAIETSLPEEPHHDSDSLWLAFDLKKLGIESEYAERIAYAAFERRPFATRCGSLRRQRARHRAP